MKAAQKLNVCSAQTGDCLIMRNIRVYLGKNTHHMKVCPSHLPVVLESYNNHRITPGISHFQHIHIYIQL